MRNDGLGAPPALASSSSVPTLAPAQTTNFQETPANNIQGRVLGPMNNEQQLRTAFLSYIPVSMDENTVNMILSTVPTFEFMIRVLNNKGEPCSFGFIRYSTIESLTAVSEIFSKVDYSAITQGKFDTLFKVTTDKNTQRYIKDYEATHGDDYISKITGKPLNESVIEVTAKLRAWYQINMANVGESILGTKEDIEKKKEPEQEPKDEEDVVIDEEDFMDVPVEQREEVLAEIKEFRILSIRQQKVKKAQHAEEIKEREKHLEAVASKALEEKSAVKISKQEDESESSMDEADDGDDDPPESDEQLERKRESRRAARMEKLFEESQRRWHARERLRTSALERERVRDEEQETRLEHDKKQAYRKFSEFKDNGEYETRTMEYYYDHAKWVKTRMQFRHRESEQDKRDAEEEALELEAKKAGQERFIESLAESLPSNTPPSSTSVGKIKLSLGGGAKKASAVPVKKSTELEKLLDDGNDESTVKPKKLIKSLNYGDGNVSVHVPEDKDVLFAWAVKWEALTEDVIEHSLKPFITNTIIEYLGVQEDDLIDFVVQHIRDHKRPEELVSELEMVCFDIF